MLRFSMPRHFLSFQRTKFAHVPRYFSSLPNDIEEQLQGLPEWQDADNAFKHGNIDIGLDSIQRVIDVLSRLGPTSPMTLYARKRLINVCEASRMYRVGGPALVSLANDAMEAKSNELELKEKLNIFLTTSSLYLHLGDGAGAVKYGHMVLRALGKAPAATQCTDIDPEMLPYFAAAHNRILSGHAHLATAKRPHDNPVPHLEAAIEAWTELMQSANDVDARAIAEVGAAVADRNAAAYAYAVGKLNESNDTQVTFSGEYVEHVLERLNRATTKSESLSSTANIQDEDDESMEAFQFGTDTSRLDPESLGAEEHLDAALSMLPGAAMIEEFGDASFDNEMAQYMREHRDTQPEIETREAKIQRWDISSYLAFVYTEQNNYDAAEKLLIKCLKEQEISLPIYHPTLARTLGFLARIHHAKEEAVTSEGLFKAALDKWEHRAGLSMQQQQQQMKKTKKDVFGLHPREVAEWQYSCEAYGFLLSEWEKRERDQKAVLESMREHTTALYNTNNARSKGLTPMAWAGRWRFGSPSKSSPIVLLTEGADSGREDDDSSLANEIRMVYNLELNSLRELH